MLHDSCPKNYHNTLIFMTFSRKISKIPEFYMIIYFARKMPEIFVIIPRKKYSLPNFFLGGRGHVLLPAPVSYAHAIMKRKLLKWNLEN